MERSKRLSIEIPKEELVLVRRENELLRKHILTLQGELSGAKLTAKYLDKELAGRFVWKLLCKMFNKKRENLKF